MPVNLISVDCIELVERMRRLRVQGHMRLLSFFFVLAFLEAVAQPGPPPSFITIVQDTSVLLPMPAVPTVCFSYGDGDTGTVVDQLFANPIFNDRGNTWRSYEFNVYMPPPMRLYVVYEGDTMVLSIAEGTYELNGVGGTGGYASSPHVIRFVAGEQVLLDHINGAATKSLARQFHRKRDAERFVHAQESRLSVGVDPLLFVSRIVLDKEVYSAGDTIHARVTGWVKLTGDCVGNALYGVYPSNSFKGRAMTPCHDRQLECGPPAVLWQDHEFLVPLQGRDPGRYRMVVCGAGQVEFDLK